MSNLNIENYIARYGKPVLRLLVKSEPGQPEECAVFKINDPSKYLVASRYKDQERWWVNTGERLVIDYLLKEVQKKKEENPFCLNCKEDDCCISFDGTCQLITKYLNAIDKK